MTRTYQICHLVVIGVIASGCHCTLPIGQPIPIRDPSQQNEVVLIQDITGGTTGGGGLGLLPFPIFFPILAMMMMMPTMGPSGSIMPLIQSVMMSLSPATTTPTPTSTPTPIFQSGALVCENGVFILDCPAPSMIAISSAIYGRTEPASVCPFMTPPLTTNCQSTTSDAIVKGLCNGQQRCTVTVSNAVLGGDPCGGTFKYLNVKYRCV